MAAAGGTEQRKDFVEASEEHGPSDAVTLIVGALSLVILLQPAASVPAGQVFPGSPSCSTRT